MDILVIRVDIANTIDTQESEKRNEKKRNNTL